MRRIFKLLASAICSSSFTFASAQVTTTSFTPMPTCAIADSETIPAYNVSAMKLLVGGTIVKPIYEIRDSGIRTAALFVRPVDDAVGDNITAMLYVYPDGECSDIVVNSWRNATIGEVVEKD